ncbi:M24 family metallopeptidase [Desulfopila inferna]|uniref:M24 family metallopeptidase n=1 Tax=Desulfopila inferna TaxID=468528 RepID=UPI001962D432|nr:aminopeptidase P family protein [Desulfopila inferna]MBM9604801.1 aminopeptidase P family protein [Desulfopila inferna]
MDYSARLALLRKSLAGKKLDAILVSRPENRRYLSGYTATDHGISETSGLLLITRKGSTFLLTDFRYREQAEREARGFKVLLNTKGLFHQLKSLLPDLGITSLGFESDYTLHSTADKLFGLGRDLAIKMIPLNGLVEKMRLVKSKDEIECIRQAVHLNEQVFQKTFKQLSGRETEIELALELGAEMRRRGAEREGFDTIVASGNTSSLPHAVPGRNVLAENAPVVIDMGLVLNGYCSDMTRSFCYGTADTRYLEIHRIVRRAQLAAISAVRSGVSAGSVDMAARKIIVDAGYGKHFGHAVGHGVGLAVHEEPRISAKSRKKLKAGMVITIEPGIYIPGWGGIRLEDMVVVREDGCENLNTDTTWLDI